MLTSSSLVKILSELNELNKTPGLTEKEIEKMFKEASLCCKKDKNGKYALDRNGIKSNLIQICWFLIIFTIKKNFIN